MLDREYELLPRSLPLERMAGGGTADGAWRCRAVGSPLGCPAAAGRPGDAGDALGLAVEIPLRGASGLLWMWPDTSPEGER